MEEELEQKSEESQDNLSRDDYLFLTKTYEIIHKFYLRKKSK